MKVIADDASEITSPYTAEEVADLAREYGATFSPGLVAWIEAFGARADDVYAGLKPLVTTGQYTSDLSAATREWAGRVDEAERLRIALIEIQESAQRQPNLELLRDVGFHEADQQKASEAIVEAYRATASNNDRRRDLLDIWGVLAPTSRAARHRLFDGVLFASLQDGGRQAFDLVKQRPALWQHPPEGRKTALKKALRNASGKGKGKDQALERLMADHGVVKRKSRGPLGLLGSEEVDED